MHYDFFHTRQFYFIIIRSSQIKRFFTLIALNFSQVICKNNIKSGLQKINSMLILFIDGLSDSTLLYNP